jgi:hypothetical protein
MNMFWFLTTSNKPRLRDPTQVQQIIETYWFDFDFTVEIEHTPNGQHRLGIQGDGWPSAWLPPPGTPSEEYCPDFNTSGQEEFAAFLVEVAPFLVETLIIQAIGTADGEFPLSACEWRVEPRSATIARIEFITDAENAAPLAMASV